MKITDIIPLISLLIVAGCGGNRQSGGQSDGLIVVDVTKTYPQKELVLQDFMDVEYVPLETNDEFVTQGGLLDVGTNLILIRNYINDGDIFFFDRHTGKGLRKINRKGQGGEEYIYINDAILDEDCGEFFVNSRFEKKILVYDLYGNFKRSFKYREDGDYSSIYSYDGDNLICYDVEAYKKEGANDGRAYHLIISKKDGSVTREINIPFKSFKSPRMMQKMSSPDAPIVTFSNIYPIIPYGREWILMEASSDTLYKYSPADGRLSPFIARTPSIQSMDPEIFLLPFSFTDSYLFMCTLKKEYDFETMTGFPLYFLMYDGETKSISEYNVYNGDLVVINSGEEYNYRRLAHIGGGGMPLNREISAWQLLQPSMLVEEYGKGHLKGRLKEIAAGLDEEDNPVLMLMKNRNITK